MQAGVAGAVLTDRPTDGRTFVDGRTDLGDGGPIRELLDLLPHQRIAQHVKGLELGVHRAGVGHDKLERARVKRRAASDIFQKPASKLCTRPGSYTPPKVLET